MKIAQAPDMRPAIAFDSKVEALSVINALKQYKSEIMSGEHLNRIESMVDEMENVLEMFEASDE
jgi:hypothetical protein|tara:strand:- start:12883 stop:13074 length:192 start_codon:yes stop_codon:yes gene_type:complete